MPSLLCSVCLCSVCVSTCVPLAIYSPEACLPLQPHSALFINLTAYKVFRLAVELFDGCLRRR